MSDPKTEEQLLEEALEETPAATPAEEPAAAPDPVPEPAPDPEPAAEKKAAPAKKKTRSPAQKDKRKADAARRKQAIADAPRPPDPSEEDQADQKRKDDLRAKMAEIQGEIDDLDGATQAKKDELRDVSRELYPHLEKSDRHVDAVKGYIASQKELRATRSANPARIKAILEAAGRAPIDQAFRSQKSRGAQRPQRPQAAATPTGGDAAPGATPADSGSE